MDIKNVEFLNSVDFLFKSFHSKAPNSQAASKHGHEKGNAQRALITAGYAEEGGEGGAVLPLRSEREGLVD